MSRESLKGNLIVFVGLAVLLGVTLLGLNLWKAFDDDLDGAINSVVEEQQERLPFRIDEYSVLEALSSEGTTINGVIRLDLSLNEIDDAYLQKLRSFLVRNYCGRENMILMMREGARFAYSYKSSEGTWVGRFELGAQECGL